MHVACAGELLPFVLARICCGDPTAPHLGCCHTLPNKPMLL